MASILVQDGVPASSSSAPPPDAKREQTEEKSGAMPPPKRRKIGSDLAVIQEDRICTVTPPPDPFPTKPIPSTVLAEEDYVDAVGSIIERDYFPDLKRLRATSSLIEAQNANDFAEVERLEAQLADIVCTPMTHRSVPSTPMSDCPPSPWGGDSEAPMEQPQMVKLPNGKWLRLNTDIRLDAFHARYTSEDNASFEAIVAQDKAKRRHEEAWIEQKEAEHNERVAVTKALSDDKIIPSALKDVEPLAVACNRHQARNMFHWNQVQSIDQGDKLQHRPVVRFKNTRFPTKMQESDSQPEALRKREQQLVDQQKDEVYNAALFKGEFGNVKEGFLKTPQIVPGVGASPLMTYGKIASTPQIVDTTLDSFQFKMQEPGKRDVLATKIQRETKCKLREANRKTTNSRLKRFGITPENTPASSSVFTPGGASSIGARSIPASSPIGALLRKCERAAKMMAGSRSVAPSTPGSIRSVIRASSCSRGDATPRGATLREGATTI